MSALLSAVAWQADKEGDRITTNNNSGDNKMRVFYFTITIIGVLLLAGCQSTDTNPTYKLTTNVTPEEAGSISPAEGLYDSGSEVELNANAEGNWVFEQWRGDLERTSNPGLVIVDGDKEVTAVFVLKDYELTINTEGEGTVKEKVVSSAKSQYQHGTTVRLTAEAKEGSVFVRWEGDIESEERVSEILVNEPKSVTAVFEPLVNTVWTMGYNFNGQLGDGSRDDRFDPE